MRIYEVKQTKTGKIIGYVRSFDQAKILVKEDDPVARKISNADLDYLFSNGMVVSALEVKVDKEGIITLLNNLIWYLSDVVEPKPEPVEKPTEQVVVETALSGVPFSQSLTSQQELSLLQPMTAQGMVRVYTVINR